MTIFSISRRRHKEPAHAPGWPGGRPPPDSNPASHPPPPGKAPNGKPPVGKPPLKPHGHAPPPGPSPPRPPPVNGKLSPSPPSPPPKDTLSPASHPSPAGKAPNGKPPVGKPPPKPHAHAPPPGPSPPRPPPVNEKLSPSPPSPPPKVTLSPAPPPTSTSPPASSLPLGLPDPPLLEHPTSGPVWFPPYPLGPFDQPRPAASSTPFHPPQYSPDTSPLLPGEPFGLPPLPTQSSHQHSSSTPNLECPYHPHSHPVSPPQRPSSRLGKLASTSFTDLSDTLHQGCAKWSGQCKGCDKVTRYLQQGAALCEAIDKKVDAVITAIDGEVFGGEKELLIYENPHHLSTQLQTGEEHKGSYLGPSAPTSSSSNHFSKVWLYSNSRLPPHLPPLKVYIPTYPLLNLAAQYSLAAYAPAPTSPLPNRTPSTTTEHIPPSLLSSNKAMVLKSVPLDSSHTIVLAIRGSQSFADWAVNFRPQPAPPTGFLDDPGNLCHAGFLGVARGMVAVVAKRLRKLVDEKAQRGDRAYSLLLTGHSAGGAVAALLYAHMLSSSPDVASALSALAPAFRRVHCVTFGAPPVSLLPLGKPDGERCKKSLFFGFVNEGDPVVRADKEVLKSLVRLWATAAPSAGAAGVGGGGFGVQGLVGSTSRLDLSDGRDGRKRSKERLQPHGKTASWSGPGPRWPIPPGVLSCAGRLVLLREGAGGGGRGGIGGSGEGGTGGRGEVEAYTIEDEMLRGVVFGDPVYHLMGLYKERIERLADRAVRGGDG